MKEPINPKKTLEQEDDMTLLTALRSMNATSELKMLLYWISYLFIFAFLYWFSTWMFWVSLGFFILCISVSSSELHSYRLKEKEVKKELKRRGFIW